MKEAAISDGIGASSAAEAGGAPGFEAPRPRFVVIGGGFGGLEVVRALGQAGIGVTLIDRHNHHLFQPLLYQVATAALSAADIAEPIRRILRDYPSVQVLFGEVERIDTAARRLHLSCGREVAYDRLVLASGAGHGYFGHDEWARYAPGLKTIENARDIRSQLLLNFERAERETDPEQQRRMMTIAVVGGGPTGVELAGSIAELSRFTLERDFRNITPASTSVTLIEAGPRLLAAFSQDLSDYARARLERLGVRIRLGEAVENIEAETITVSGRTEPVGMVIWAAGVKASPLAGQLGVETDRSGRVLVDRNLAVRGLADVFALGDVAHCPDEEGRPLPGLAQVAKQQGTHLGRALARQAENGAVVPPFRYRSRGNAAIIGRHAAVFEHAGFKMKGWFAWLAWALVHVYLLVGFQHRLLVSMQWLWAYLTYDRGARLIAGDFVEDADPRHRPERSERSGRADPPWDREALAPARVQERLVR